LGAILVLLEVETDGFPLNGQSAKPSFASQNQADLLPLPEDREYYLMHKFRNILDSKVKQKESECRVRAVSN